MIPLLPTKTADTAYMGIFCKCDQALSKFNYSTIVQLFQLRLVGVAFYVAYLSWDWMGTWMLGERGDGLEVGLDKRGAGWVE